MLWESVWQGGTQWGGKGKSRIPKGKEDEGMLCVYI
jgi:hypothetical protein